MQLVPGDFFESSYPECDVHFYAQIFHDWSLDKCKVIAQKSWDALPKDGLIIIYDQYNDEDQEGPAVVASLNLDLLVLYGNAARQHRIDEMRALLEEIGFSFEYSQKIFAHWGVVVARKP